MRHVAHKKVVLAFGVSVAAGFFVLLMFGKAPSLSSSPSFDSDGLFNAQGLPNIDESHDAHESVGTSAPLDTNGEQDHSISQELDALITSLEQESALPKAKLEHVRDEIEGILDEGKLHVTTETLQGDLIENAENLLRKEGQEAHSILLYANYLGILGNSWGAVLKTPEGVQITILSSKGEHTVKTSAAFQQRDWS